MIRVADHPAQRWQSAGCIWLQKHCHVDGQMKDVIGAHNILSVKDVALTDFRGELCAEFVQ